MSEVKSLIAEIKSKGLLRAGDKLELLYVVAAQLQDNYAALKAERDAMAAENVALKSAISYVCDTDNQPDYQYDGMGCGIEDRGIIDRYEAARYGWDEALERMYSEVIPCASDIETPATDAYLNSVRAEGVELVMAHPAISLCSLTHACEEIAAKLRADKDGE